MAAMGHACMGNVCRPKMAGHFANATQDGMAQHVTSQVITCTVFSSELEFRQSSCAFGSPMTYKVSLLVVNQPFFQYESLAVACMI